MKNCVNVILWVLFFSNVYSNTFYIDPINGNNSGIGTISSPWKTFEEVINANLIESYSFVTPYNSNNP